MQLPKHSEEAKAYFRGLVSVLGPVEVRPMFGSVAAFVNGTMFAGLFGEAIGVKLDAAGVAELSALPGAGPFGPAGRPMGGYVSLPPDLPDVEKIAWMHRARDHVSLLPPKPSKSSRKNA